MANGRNAWRKHKFNNNDVKEMLAMIKDGKTTIDVAKKVWNIKVSNGRYIKKKQFQKLVICTVFNLK